MYAPKDMTNIKIGERCFYTTRNAKYIDTARQLINNIPEQYRLYFRTIKRIKKQIFS